jgi:hypothetical protein
MRTRPGPRETEPSKLLLLGPGKVRARGNRVAGTLTSPLLVNGPGVVGAGLEK